MNRKLPILASIILAICTMGNQLAAQMDQKFTYEEVKQQCAGLPLDKRARISVTRFSVTTRTSDRTVDQNVNANNTLKALSTVFGNGAAAPKADEIPPILGDNLTTMLTNALQGIGCYRVLESLKNNDDLKGEIEAGKGSLSSGKAPKAGFQLGAQLVATGEVIEYSDKSKGANILGVGAKKKYVKMGFNLKLINPETRDVIASRVFRVESKGANSVSVLGIVTTDIQDPAVAAVMEDGVIQAVAFLARVRDSLNINSANIPGSSMAAASSENEVYITLSGANYQSYNNLTALVTTVPGFLKMEKSLSGGVANVSVSYKGKADEFIDALVNKLSTKFEVIGVDNGKVELKSK
jgi:curli biogenesis system outer membrane secretion channel CsgG